VQCSKTIARANRNTRLAPLRGIRNKIKYYTVIDLERPYDVTFSLSSWDNADSYDPVRFINYPRSSIDSRKILSRSC
jgi:hypothetical protein